MPVAIVMEKPCAKFFSETNITEKEGVIMISIMIKDLPNEATISEQEMKEIRGGIVGTWWTSRVTDAAWETAISMYGSDEEEFPLEMNNAVAGVRG